MITPLTWAVLEKINTVWLKYFYVAGWQYRKAKSKLCKPKKKPKQNKQKNDTKTKTKLRSGIFSRVEIVEYLK